MRTRETSATILTEELQEDMYRFEKFEIVSDFEGRAIEREYGDKDIFFDTDLMSVNIEFEDDRFSRIQFPKVRMILVRTSPISSAVTVHFLRDIDLFSSFVNFELECGESTLNISKEDGYIRFFLEKK